MSNRWKYGRKALAPVNKKSKLMGPFVGNK